jgi:hypothetical protein
MTEKKSKPCGQKEMEQPWDAEMGETTLNNLMTHIDDRTLVSQLPMGSGPMESELRRQSLKLKGEYREFQQKSMPLFRSVRNHYRKLQNEVWKLESLYGLKAIDMQWHCEDCDKLHSFRDEIPFNINEVFDMEDRELNLEEDLFCDKEAKPNAWWWWECNGCGEMYKGPKELAATDGLNYICKPNCKPKNK